MFRSLGKASITLTELQTLAVEVEAILNDRPITSVSSDCVDEEPLAPSHLLNGRRIASLPYSIVDDDPSNPDDGSASDTDETTCNSTSPYPRMFLEQMETLVPDLSLRIPQNNWDQ